jgi:hypothetical protein
MVLELLAPSAAQLVAGVEPPPPKVALALLLGIVLTHTLGTMSAHRSTTKAKRDARDWGRASDAAAEAARGAGGAVGFPPPFKRNGASS